MCSLIHCYAVDAVLLLVVAYSLPILGSLPGGAPGARSAVHSISVSMVSSVPTLLFDFDGTVAETEPMILEASNRMLTQFGITWEVDQYAELLKVGNTEKRLTHWFDKYNCWPSGEGSRAALVKKLKNEKDDHFDTLLREANRNGKFQCRPGVLRCMEEAILALEGQVAIVSNSNTDIVKKQWEVLVKDSDYHYLLDSVKIFGGDLAPNGRRKPHPDLYQMAISDLGVQTSDCCVIEDSNEGMRAALAAGLSNVIITKNQYTLHDDFTGSAVVLDNLDQGLFSLEEFLSERSCLEVQVID